VLEKRRLHQPAAVSCRCGIVRRGQAAFRERLPTATSAPPMPFRKASSLQRDRCEYSLHLAEALPFLRSSKAESRKTLRHPHEKQTRL